MPKILAILLTISAGYHSHSADVPSINIPKLADAIYLAEGGHKTKHPYGILSIKTANPRQVCIRTITNRLKTWDGKGSFIAYLGVKYCPPSADPIGHRNWVRNVNFHYNH